MTVETLNSVEDFDAQTKKSNIAVVLFSAEWAEQCAQVKDVLEALSALPEILSSNLKLYVCDAEKLSEISFKYKIDSVPTILFFKCGSLVDRVNGAFASQITAKVKNLCQINTATSATAPPLEERLKSLINRHKVMIFMKGDRDVPKCGFSKTLIQIMNDTGVEYGTFDILTDEEVRQGLKKYSDWPTYPQLYVKGELIGGLDIVKELVEGGEFVTTLND